MLSGDSWLLSRGRGFRARDKRGESTPLCRRLWDMNLMNRKGRETRMQNMDAGYVRRASLASEVLLQGKWRVQILCAMRSGPIRIGQLARLIPGTSKKILAQHLRKLEADGIVSRKDLSDIVLHVEYELGEDLKEQVCALIDHLAQWGSLYLELRK